MDKSMFDAAAKANPAWLAEHTTAAVNAALAEAAKPKAATLDDLQKEFPGDQNAAFVLNQLKAGASMGNAIAAHRTALVGEVAALKAKLETAETKLAESDPGSAGLKAPLNTAGGQKGGNAGTASGSLLGDSMDALAKQRQK